MNRGAKGKPGWCKPMVFAKTSDKAPHSTRVEPTRINQMSADDLALRWCELSLTSRLADLGRGQLLKSMPVLAAADLHAAH